MASQQCAELHHQAGLLPSLEEIVLLEDLLREDSPLARPAGRDKPCPASHRVWEKDESKDVPGKHSPMGTKPLVITQRERLTAEQPQAGKHTGAPGWPVPSFTDENSPERQSKPSKIHGGCRDETE